MSIPAGRACVT